MADPRGGSATTGRVGCCLPRMRLLPGNGAWAREVPCVIDNPRSFHMPIILWLLGVPLTVIVLLMLFHVL